MPLLIVIILWFAAAGGSRLNQWLKASPTDSLPFERRLFGVATGLIVLAYSVLALGLTGELAATPIFCCCLTLGAIGWNEHRDMAAEVAHAVKGFRLNLSSTLVSILFVGFFLTSLTGSFTPPTSVEYDSLSYHLADPKIYLAHHRIIYLPWESHSNFAFTMEMLYTVGLSVHSVPLAKLFHLTMGIIAVCGTYLVGRRVHSVAVGVLSALLLASLPLIFWEAGTAYVDLGACAFGVLSLLALAAYLIPQKSDRGWLNVAIIMMAGMVSIKATSLVTGALFSFSIAAIGEIKKQPRTKWMLDAFAFGVLSVVAGSVWYVKSWIVTGNPFFPFAYSIFGGRHWSTLNSIGYAHSQAEFGAGHSSLDLLLAPWNLILYLVPAISTPDGVNNHPFNDFPTYLVSLSPVLLASLFVPALWQRKTPAPITALAVYALVSVVIWFLLTQQVRYLLPVIPVFCLLSAFVLVELWHSKLLARFAIAALWAASLLFSCVVGVMLVKQEAAVATGRQSVDDYVSRGLFAYPAMKFLNTQTPTSAGVVFYGEPTDFYCDRPYMWGEPGHGIVIPYGSMLSSADLKEWLLEHGFHYIFIDYAEAPIAAGPGMDGLVDGLTRGSGHTPVFAQGSIEIYSIG